MDNFIIQHHNKSLIPMTIQIKHNHDNKYNVQQQDERFIQIQNLIQAKKQMLFEKQKQLCIISKQNEFLDVVKKDYEKYNDNIYKQKQDQIKALNILDTYIKELTKSGELTKYDLEDAKEEQKKILNELDTIKRNLDNIVQETKEL
jgi:hypothetical protein